MLIVTEFCMSERIFPLTSFIYKKTGVAQVSSVFPNYSSALGLRFPLSDHCLACSSSSCSSRLLSQHITSPRNLCLCSISSIFYKTTTTTHNQPNKSRVHQWERVADGSIKKQFCLHFPACLAIVAVNVTASTLQVKT